MWLTVGKGIVVMYVFAIGNSYFVFVFVCVCVYVYFRGYLTNRFELVSDHLKSIKTPQNPALRPSSWGFQNIVIFLIFIIYSKFIFTPVPRLNLNVFFLQCQCFAGWPPIKDCLESNTNNLIMELNTNTIGFAHATELHAGGDQNLFEIQLKMRIHVKELK